jgi:hypothetical protein
MVELLPRCFLQCLSQDPTTVTEMTDVISTDAPSIELGCERIDINPTLPLFIASRIIKWMVNVYIISLSL